MQGLVHSFEGSKGYLPVGFGYRAEEKPYSIVSVHLKSRFLFLFDEHRMYTYLPMLTVMHEEPG